MRRGGLVALASAFWVFPFGVLRSQTEVAPPPSVASSTDARSEKEHPSDGAPAKSGGLVRTPVGPLPESLFRSNPLRQSRANSGSLQPPDSSPSIRAPATPDWDESSALRRWSRWSQPWGTVTLPEPGAWGSVVPSVLEPAIPDRRPESDRSPAGGPRETQPGVRDAGGLLAGGKSGSTAETEPGARARPANPPDPMGAPATGEVLPPAVAPGTDPPESGESPPVDPAPEVLRPETATPAPPAGPSRPVVQGQVFYGDRSRFSSPAVLRLEEAIAAVPEYRLLSEKVVTKDSAEYLILASRGTQVLRSAAEAVAKHHGFDLIGERGKVWVPGGRPIPDVTRLVVSVLKTTSRR